MPFPDLQPKPDPNSPTGAATLYAEAEGIPDDGDNTFGLPFVGLGIDPSLIDERWLQYWADIDGWQGTVPGVTQLTFVSLDPNKELITFNFSQLNPGLGTCRLTIRLVHSTVR